MLVPYLCKVSIVIGVNKHILGVLVLFQGFVRFGSVNSNFARFGENFKGSIIKLLLSCCFWQPYVGCGVGQQSGGEHYYVWQISLSFFSTLIKGLHSFQMKQRTTRCFTNCSQCTRGDKLGSAELLTVWANVSCWYCRRWSRRNKESVYNQGEWSKRGWMWF